MGRGCLLLDIARHPLRLAIARAPRPELRSWTVVGVLLGEAPGMLDALVRNDVVRMVVLDEALGGPEQDRG